MIMLYPDRMMQKHILDDLPFKTRMDGDYQITYKESPEGTEWVYTIVNVKDTQ